MKKALVLSLVVLFAMSLTSVAFAKKATRDTYRISEPLFDNEVLPPDLAGQAGPSLSAAAADTFNLAWYGFDTGGLPDEMGWTKVDLYDQLDNFWHVADDTELDGGLGPNPPFPSPNGQLNPLSGDQSMWCGKYADTQAPYCGWSLPGYGNNWDQTLTAGPLVCDSLTLSYTVYWDAEDGYDWTNLEWSTNADDPNEANIVWNEFAVGDTFSASPGHYDGHGPFPGDGGFGALLTESFGVGPQLAGGSATGKFWVRFHCQSDGAWSGEDNLWLTDGMILVDDITLDRRNADGTLIVSDFEDFESPGSSPGDHSAGLWTGAATPAFAHYHALYPGITVLQEDPCFTVFNNVWAFFDDPNITNYFCHTPDPKPLQGAMPYKNDRDQYMFNEIWSPLIPNVGAGDLYFLNFDVYQDMPLDNLQFYVWHVRQYPSGVGSCPGLWEDDFNVYWDAGLPRQWVRYDNVNFAAWNVSPQLQGNPTHIQIALGAWDYCGFVCGQFGTGSCHSHAPLLDNVHLQRVNVLGPQYTALHIYDFFQDNFAADGTTTGHSRADIALDVQNNQNPAVLPGDSAVVTVGGITTDAFTGIGPSVYAYVAVWPQGQLDKTGAHLEAPETRGAVGKRFPFVDTQVHDGVTWYCFRMDSVFTQAGGLDVDKYCVDLNDWVFTPCDTVCYVICAKGPSGDTYLSRFGQGSRGFFTTPDLWTALNSPMEFTILPAGGWKNGGDILYVDYADGGLTQLFYDTAFEILQIDDIIDRYDATPGRGNGLGDRVKNIQNQLVQCYRKILWDAANVNSTPIGDGTLWEKSDDLGTLYTFLDTHQDNPGVFLSGNDIARAWEEDMTGASATQFKSIFMNHTLVSGDHKAAGEPLSPVLTGVATCFIHSGTPDELVAFGGCPILRDFDLIDPAGASVATFRSGGGAGASYGVQQTTSPTSGGSTARVILSGFGLQYIRDDAPGFPPDRVDYLRDVLIWLSNVVPEPVGIPDASDRFENRLANNYPNPFNPTTKIQYSIKDQGAVTLKVYNAAGQLVRTLVNDVLSPQEGGFTVTWDGKNNAGQSVSSGVYFYKLTAKNFSETKKMVLLK